MMENCEFWCIGVMTASKPLARSRTVPRTIVQTLNTPYPSSTACYLLVISTYHSSQAEVRGSDSAGRGPTRWEVGRNN